MRSARSRLLRMATLLAFVATLSSDASGVEVEIGLSIAASTIDESGFFPPDTMAAVGVDHIVELINGRYTVFQKTDGAILETSNEFTFWSNAGVVSFDAFDPRILYDADSDRWFAVMALNRRSANSGIAIAVSNTSDPTDGWTGFEVDGDSQNVRWVDFPMLGINGEGVFITAPMLTIAADSIAGVSVLVVPKADLTAPTPTLANSTYFESLSSATMGIQPQPVVDLDQTNGPEMMLSDLSFLASLVRSDVVGGVMTPSVVGSAPIPTTPFGFPPGGPQPGPKLDLETNGFFGSNIVQLDGRVWGVSAVDIAGKAALRWLEIDPTTSEIVQSGTLTDDELAFYYPSIAVNEFGVVVIGCSGSSESQFPSSYAFVGETVEGVTTFGDPLLLRAGVSDYQIESAPGRNRWGDYSATVRDPVDSNIFWTAQEYVAATDTWGTEITEIRTQPDAECSNGIDDDGDGAIDFAGSDPGCATATDPSERSVDLPCDNGLDDDGDGRIDFDPATLADIAHVAGFGDPGCRAPDSPREDPRCQNGIDDDGVIGTDFDGGVSAVGAGGADPDGADPHCFGTPWINSEKPRLKTCGLGAGSALILPVLALLRRRPRGRR